MLEISDLAAAYSGIRALKGVSLNVAQGEMVALIGPNGAGKSTLLNTISGLVRKSAGSIRFEGRDLAGMSAYQISRIGLLQVPEGRQILGDLSVQENLQLGTTALHHRATTHTLERIHDLFPILAERRDQRAGSLSGGQQQMLAIGRALMGAPRLLLLDEPSLGLSPLMAHQVLTALRRLNAEGLTILLVEQNARQALKSTHRAYLIEQGLVVKEGRSDELSQDSGVIAHYLGQAAGAASH
ncbi:MAG: ABC transporter ATP-binding protein [Rhodoferax sp.]|nr:ABC transporter ATP-binding protein [Rhodoferax sp.]